MMAFGTLIGLVPSTTTVTVDSLLNVVFYEEKPICADTARIRYLTSTGTSSSLLFAANYYRRPQWQEKATLIKQFPSLQQSARHFLFFIECRPPVATGT